MPTNRSIEPNGARWIMIGRCGRLSAPTYSSSKRFELEYVGADNRPHRPIMIHRAPFGSMERFVGILIEHFAGAFPTWLAPEQVRVVTVRAKFRAYAATAKCTV